MVVQTAAQKAGKKVGQTEEPMVVERAAPSAVYLDLMKVARMVAMMAASWAKQKADQSVDRRVGGKAGLSAASTALDSVDQTAVDWVAH